MVGDYAFAYTAIVSVDLSGATYIGDFAFLKETLTPFEVILGENLADIGENPFALCKLSAFESFVTEEFGNEEFKKPTINYNISDTVKIIDGMIYRVVPNGLELISYTGNSTVVTVADGTVRISAQAFVGSDVIHVVLPSTLRAIGHKAFYACDSLTMVSFTSYNAPILEEEYDYSYWLSAENLPATGKYQYQDAYTLEVVEYEGLGIVPYFMWNATDTPTVIYYGANFANYIGRVDQAIAMVRPANGLNYDSFIYDQYFALSVNGQAAADATTLAAIAAINRIPANITLKDKAIVVAARAAYDKITSDTQRGLVTNYDILRKAEQRIADMEFLQQTPDVPTDDSVVQTDNGKMVKLVWVIVLASGLVVTLALATIALLICLKLKKQMGNPQTASDDSTDEAPTEKTEETLEADLIETAETEEPIEEAPEAEVETFENEETNENTDEQDA